MSANAAIFALAYGALWIPALVRAARRRSAGPLWDALTFHALLLAAAAALFPFYWMFAGAVKSAAEAARTPPTLLPELARAGDWSGLVRQAAENFRAAWDSPPGGLTFGTYFKVSLISSAAATLGVLATSALAGFALARMRFRGRGAIFALVVATLAVPPQVLMIPNYLTLERLGWLDSYPALVVPFLASVFAIFLLRQHFMMLPEELWDAARIDGAGRGAFLIRIALPLARPALLAVAIFTFLAQWNSLLWPMIATTSPEMRPLMAGLQSFNEEISAEPNLLMAASAFSLLPPALAFLFMQRAFTDSVARTGIKG